jgi:3-oxoacyl-(acyl-carrier-protein) synthase
MSRRVVITGLGVVAPNGVGLDAFTHAIKMGFLGYGKIQI